MNIYFGLRSNVGPLAMILVLLTVFLSPPSQSAQKNEAATLPCRDQVLSQLKQWEGAQDWQVVADPGSAALYEAPTSELGVWLRLQVQRSGEVFVYRETQDTLVRVGWNSPHCQAKLELLKWYPSQRQTDLESLNDMALKKFMEKHRRGVIVSWSPHMPWSVEAVRRLQKIASEHRAAVIPVLDPLAHKKLAKKLAEQHQFSPWATLPLKSMELSKRGLMQHYPSMILFQDKKFIGPVSSGLRHSPQYQAFLQEGFKK